MVPETLHGSVLGGVIGLAIGALFVPFALVAARANKRAAEQQAADEAAGRAPTTPTMDPGLRARKQLGIWVFGAIVVTCALFGALGALTQHLGGAAAFFLLGGFSLWIALRLHRQVAAG